jgi:hypothetical protein
MMQARIVPVATVLSKMIKNIGEAAPVTDLEEI